MKIKILIIFCLTVLLSSCFNDLKDGDRDQFGITFIIDNNTDLEYKNAFITIGGIKDGEFIDTESYTFPTLTITGTKEWNTYEGNGLRFAHYEDRWNPNLDLIRNLPSEEAYFKLTLENGNETLLQKVNEEGILTNLLSIAIPENSIIKNDYGGLYIGIWIEGTISSLRKTE